MALQGDQRSAPLVRTLSALVAGGMVALVPDQQQAMPHAQAFQRIQPSRQGLVGHAGAGGAHLAMHGLPGDALQGFGGRLYHGPSRAAVDNVVDIAACDQRLGQFGRQTHLAGTGRGLTQKMRVLRRQRGERPCQTSGLPGAQRRQRRVLRIAWCGWQDHEHSPRVCDTPCSAKRCRTLRFASHCPLRRPLCSMAACSSGSICERASGNDCISCW